MTKKWRAVRPLRSKAAGNGQAPQVKAGKTRTRKLEEPILTEGRIVAFPSVAIKRVVPVSLDVRVIARGLVPLPGGHFHCPAIGIERKILFVRWHYLLRKHRYLPGLWFAQTGIHA